MFVGKLPLYIAFHLLVAMKIPGIVYNNRHSMKEFSIHMNAAVSIGTIYHH
jgi:uncharacterized protein YybS (DUF2232 family)